MVFSFFFFIFFLLQLKSLGARAANELAKSLGIDIHLLAPAPELKFDNQRDAKTIVGFNDKTVLLMPGQKARSQDRQHLDYGQDLGIDMVQSNSRGYAFSLTNYNSLDAANQKKFLKTAASAIATQITKTESVNECICLLYKGLFAREFCRDTDKITKSRK